MQSGFCAYCECKLRTGHKQIEHFRKRDGFPQLTFQWGNLFGSCKNSSRCGDYKDTKAGHFESDNLIKPDEGDLSQHCIFLVTGKIRPKSTLKDSSPHDLQSVEETLRVFNLNEDPSLVGARRAAIQRITPQVKELYSCADSFSDEDWDKFLVEALKDIEDNEFQTALEHTWRYNRTY
ncbi:MAG: Unknown protein [uncultured Thiotrichaceae bacterium]|uniref:TIGR02646 family protein n=1 Tax=uncultured Thiotrichaceae bacterium TaxID=298394 RepID=A0A6S6SAE5_9GAMM|nr:MAG: Unknown protein [uncultured Thiotrichaceae bacterium]